MSTYDPGQTLPPVSSDCIENSLPRSITSCDCSCGLNSRDFADFVQEQVKEIETSQFYILKNDRIGFVDSKTGFFIPALYTSLVKRTFGQQNYLIGENNKLFDSFDLISGKKIFSGFQMIDIFITEKSDVFFLVKQNRKTSLYNSSLKSIYSTKSDLYPLTIDINSCPVLLALSTKATGQSKLIELPSKAIHSIPNGTLEPIFDCNSKTFAFIICDRKKFGLLSRQGEKLIDFISDEKIIPLGENSYYITENKSGKVIEIK